MNRTVQLPCVVMLSPSLQAVSGVSTHTNLLFRSTLSNDYRFVLFQVGNEGRAESLLRRMARLLVSPFQLAGVILAQRADIVHINTAMDTKGYWRDIWYLAVARLLRRKVVFQIHGGALPQEFFAYSRFLTWLMRRALGAASALVLLSRVEQDAYERFLPRSRVAFIPNAINPDGLLEADSAKAGIAPSLHLAYLGRLIPSKGVREIVEAVRILRDSGISVRLSIAGAGPFETDLRESVISARLEDRIVFKGPLFGEAKLALWRDAHLFVFPTYHKEGLPYSLLEAMAAATVPIICPVGGVPDVIEDRVHGRFVAPKDPQALADILRELDADRPAIVRMAGASRARLCQDYAIGRLARDFEALYAALGRGD